MEFEFIRIENALGWRAFPIEGKVKTLSENPLRKIIDAKEKRVYETSLPILSAEEAEVLKEIIIEYRKEISAGNKVDSKIISDFCERNNFELDGEQEKALKQTFFYITSVGGILNHFLKDDSLEEIAVIGVGKHKPIFVYDSAFGWLESNVYFSSKDELINTINSMASGIGRRVTLAKPNLNATLRDGSRINACIEPASLTGPNVTVRKFKSTPLTPAFLIKSGNATAEEFAFLWMAIEADCSVLVCGNTGSGKTTLLNSIFNFVPKEERIICVEETPEINIPHKHFVRLCAVDEIEIEMNHLINNTLRMRPDRVIIGEVREAKEVEALMNTLLAGQGKGSYGTFHAQSAQDALNRLVNLGAREQDLKALDLIVMQKRWTDNSGGLRREKRQLVEISEVDFSDVIKERKIFFRRKKEKVNSKAVGKICDSFGFSENEFLAELKARADYLEGLRKKEDFFDAIKNYGKGN